MGQVGIASVIVSWLYLQFENCECSHAVPIVLALELSIEVVVQEREVVRVVPVDP